MTAAVVAELAGDRTRCTTLRSAPPISLRDTPDGLYLVASGAGPVGGDDLHLDVDVRCGASLVVRSAAASMVLPGPSGRASSLRVRARVHGSLRWEPEPTILVAGCDHRTTTTIDLAAGGTLVWREVVVLGRHDEPTGSLLQRLHVDRDGVPLLRNELPVGPRWPGAEGPAGTDGALVVTSVLVVGLEEPALPKGLLGAVMRLTEDAWTGTWVERREVVAHVRKRSSAAMSTTPHTTKTSSTP
jgi:urease accessory protein